MPFVVCPGASSSVWYQPSSSARSSADFPCAVVSMAAQGATTRGRVDLGTSRNLREHAARGTMINSAFQLGLAGLGLLRRFIVAAFLTRAEFGMWGIVMVTLLTLLWLKQVGVADKFVQQDEPDQEAAFQK